MEKLQIIESSFTFNRIPNDKEISKLLKTYQLLGYKYFIKFSKDSIIIQKDKDSLNNTYTSVYAISIGSYFDNNLSFIDIKPVCHL